jgi:3-hydroxyacyl-[acyl-carrier-protein] dehydratase
MSAGPTGRAELMIAIDHPAFAGHFPGMPIVPGVVLLDEALHAIGAAIGVDLSACQISSVKFLSPVNPAEPVAVSYEMSGNRALRFDITSGERKVATGSIRVPEAG